MNRVYAAVAALAFLLALYAGYTLAYPGVSLRVTVEPGRPYPLQPVEIDAFMYVGGVGVNATCRFESSVSNVTATGWPASARLVFPAPGSYRVNITCAYGGYSASETVTVEVAEPAIRAEPHVPYAAPGYMVFRAPYPLNCSAALVAPWGVARGEFRLGVFNASVPPVEEPFTVTLVLPWGSYNYTVEPTRPAIAHHVEPGYAGVNETLVEAWVEGGAGRVADASIMCRCPWGVYTGVGAARIQCLSAGVCECTATARLPWPGVLSAGFTAACLNPVEALRVTVAEVGVLYALLNVTPVCAVDTVVNATILLDGKVYAHRLLACNRVNYILVEAPWGLHNVTVEYLGASASIAVRVEPAPVRLPGRLVAPAGGDPCAAAPQGVECRVYGGYALLYAPGGPEHPPIWRIVPVEYREPSIIVTAGNLTVTGCPEGAVVTVYANGSLVERLVCTGPVLRARAPTPSIIVYRYGWFEKRVYVYRSGVVLPLTLRAGEPLKLPRAPHVDHYIVDGAAYSPGAVLRLEPGVHRVGIVYADGRVEWVTVKVEPRRVLVVLTPTQGGYMVTVYGASEAEVYSSCTGILVVKTGDILPRCNYTGVYPWVTVVYARR